MVEGNRARERVALIHPDLGIGGAERLVVDAALELSALGYEVRDGTPPWFCFFCLLASLSFSRTLTNIT